MQQLKPAIFFDRDGVINENREHYVRSWHDITILPVALTAFKRLFNTNFRIVIVTNQAGIGKNLYSLETAEQINANLIQRIVDAGGRVDRAYLCPHRKEDKCNCRKPKPGMLLNAAIDLGIDISSSWMIGDAITDMQAGKAAGIRSLMVMTGRGQEQQHLLLEHQLTDIQVFADIGEAVSFILQQSTNI